MAPFRLRALLAGASLLVLAPVAASPAVLVELFTAHGCPFCPPADRLLNAMGTDPDLSREVVPLSFHVDYWNTRSWNDRFSDPAWTRRQKEYVLAAHASDIYTPNAVIGGTRQCNGADVGCIHAAVDAERAAPQGTVSVSASAPRGDVVEVVVNAQAPAGARGLDVMVALYESGLVTEVTGGENAHKTLHNDYVVRRLERAFRVDGDAGRTGRVKIKLDKDWVRERLGVAAFLQSPKTHEVRGAAAIALQ